MVKFLLPRPVATCMTFVALFILGVISYRQLPVSLLPDIDIPEITVRASYPKFTAREMETHIAYPLRNALQQCTGLKSIQSKSSNGRTLIKMRFNYGVDTDLAAIEANEKIDRQFSSLPRDLQRPNVIKASATDIPVFFLNMSFADEDKQNAGFLELSRFAQHVIKKRIEQLQEVALVDMSGIERPLINIVPDLAKLSSFGLSYQHIEDVISRNNFTIGNITVNEGYYQYSIRVSSPMRSIKEIQALPLKTGLNTVRLSEIANISLQAKKKDGLFVNGSNQAISMAVIKQADAKMQDLKKSVHEAIKVIIKDYPHLHFDIAQDQTRLLDYTIGNLKQTLILGAILAFIVLFLFISNIRLPLLMTITVPVALVVSILFMLFFNISINIISLSGLVLGIGLMIDNSIIIIDNITQFREKGEKILSACAKATNEVIRPLLSSALTTSAVFVPLIFVSGIAGALFFDQAITVTIALLLSFVVSITLLPVLYLLLIKNKNEKNNTKANPLINVLKPYEKGFYIVMKHKTLFTILFLLLLPLSVFLFYEIKKEGFPELHQNELIAAIKWNENIGINENRKRMEALTVQERQKAQQVNMWIGLQDYILSNAYEVDRSESKIYMSFNEEDHISKSKGNLQNYLKHNYPNAEISFSTPDNLFTTIFAKNTPPIILKLKPKDESAHNHSIVKVIEQLDKILGKEHINALGQYTFVNLTYDREKLILYNVSEQTLIATLKTAFNENQIGTLNTSNEVLPMVMGTGSNDLNEIIQTTTVKSEKGADLPLKFFLNITEEEDFEIVYAGKDGVFIPVHYDATQKSRYEIEKKVSSFIVRNNLPFKLEWSGALYDFDNHLKELIGILIISILLLYFILAIQFESLLQPLIVLIEIPLDISGALLMLLLFGSSLNIMSAIGIIVMTGIIINDSILKIDTINRLYRTAKLSLLESIHQGGSRRIRPIIMTSLTTILALVPFLVGKGLGAALQKPLALAVIGGLALGTFVSLYFIPLCYWWIYKNKKEI